MIALYHYTSLQNLRGIIDDGMIWSGHAFVNSTDLDSAVCLTSDTESCGHGLPDGRAITLEQAMDLQAWRVEGGKLFSLDHTEYRLTVSVPQRDNQLVYVPALLSAWPEALAGLEIAAYHPCTKRLSRAKQNKTRKHLRSGKLRGKSSTWWYYFGHVPTEWVTEIGVKEDEAHYSTMPFSQFQELLAAQRLEKFGHSDPGTQRSY